MEALKSTIFNIPVAGIQPVTSIDFPGKLAAVIFTAGCPWNCRYCHNAALRFADNNANITPDTVESFLQSRAGFLDGVVISGGEPTLHSALPHLLTKIKKLGFATAIHTNGNFPEMIGLLLARNLVDFVAMDIKAPPRIYDRITRAHNTGIAVARSISLILSSKVDYEFRTTFHPHLLSEEELMDTIHAVYNSGGRRYYIQRFRCQGVYDEELAAAGDVVVLPEAVVKEARRIFDVFDVR
ncbi:MAG: anaerobic ribonucleoside-triphosphate reductase activating protein [Candidatus Latescibacteria bacterium]|nr:anaerobic ribonucleoside-triphosphate reductase activating protein [Candidatus Latescibacterota bacterium]